MARLSLEPNLQQLNFERLQQHIAREMAPGHGGRRMKRSTKAAHKRREVRAASARNFISTAQKRALMRQIDAGGGALAAGGAAVGADRGLAAPLARRGAVGESPVRAAAPLLADDVAAAAGSLSQRPEPSREASEGECGPTDPWRRTFARWAQEGSLAAIATELRGYGLSALSGPSSPGRDLTLLLSTLDDWLDGDAGEENLRLILRSFAGVVAGSPAGAEDVRPTAARVAVALGGNTRQRAELRAWLHQHLYHDASESAFAVPIPLDGAIQVPEGEGDAMVARGRQAQGPAITDILVSPKCAARMTPEQLRSLGDEAMVALQGRMGVDPTFKAVLEQEAPQLANWVKRTVPMKMPAGFAFVRSFREPIRTALGRDKALRDLEAMGRGGSIDMGWVLNAALGRVIGDYGQNIFKVFRIDLGGGVVLRDKVLALHPQRPDYPDLLAQIELKLIAAPHTLSPEERSFLRDRLVDAFSDAVLG